MTRITAATTAILAAIVLAGCSPTTKTASTGTATPEITVDASDTGCAVSTAKVAAGSYTFVVTNTGSKVTEFYVYGDGERVLGEAENISPGLQRRLDIRFDRPGTYQTACKPGMTGDGIRGDFTVTG